VRETLTNRRARSSCFDLPGRLVVAGCSLRVDEALPGIAATRWTAGARIAHAIWFLCDVVRAMPLQAIYLRSGPHRACIGESVLSRHSFTRVKRLSGARYSG
jgi:hypothetical protein